MGDEPRILVLGIGNLLWADEGFGVRAVEALAEGRAFPERVTLMDGGTQGFNLLGPVEEADALLLFDAVDFGLEPATLHVLRDAEVPAFMGAKKMSLHQTGFQDVLAAAALKDRAPQAMTLIGCQPVELEDYGGGLRPEVAARLPEAVTLGLAELRARWGVTAQAREGGHGLSDGALSRDVYEGGRPSEDEAWRRGDVRFLSRKAG